jgi:hypothetical protein
MTAYVAKPPMKSAVLFGWEDRNGLVPVYFKGQMSSDILQDLVDGHNVGNERLFYLKS